MRHRPDVGDGELLALATTGLSLRRIAAEVGISHEAVRMRLAGLATAHNQ